tara:strand:- start:525 stop:773 length:249 start_codon:yes stop_codon:yes gene_type:complete
MNSKNINNNKFKNNSCEKYKYTKPKVIKKSNKIKKKSKKLFKNTSTKKKSKKSTKSKKKVTKLNIKKFIEDLNLTEDKNIFN